ncbi:MAG: patatin-like phospholipase family protein [Syntrophales bacterium]|jgi:NTE family protein|nr:patatin-like phospholipase family protein [Syntrophales bacterium]
MTKKIGIALGSGSARGWSHIGVLQSIVEAGIAVDFVCGTSVGALVAGSFAAGFLEPLDRWARRLSWSHIVGFMDMKIPRSGLIEGEKISGYLREMITDPLIENLPVPFAAVATDLKTGREVWLREGSLIEVVRASISLPGIFTPCGRNGQWLVDGGLVNPVPTSLCRAMGADIVVAVDLNSDIMGKKRIQRMAAPPEGEGKGVSLSEQGRWADFLKQVQLNGKLKLFGQMFQEQPDRSPTLFDVLATSVNIMQDKINQQRLLEDPPDLVIRPKLSDIGLMEFNRAAEAIDEGKREMDMNIPALRELMVNAE